MRSARRVLLLGDTLGLGGTEGQFVEIATGLSRSGWDLSVSCLRAEGPLRARLEAAGLSPSSCGPRSLRSPRLLLAVLALGRRLRARRIHVVHAFDFYSNVLGVLAGRLARVPVVVASQRDLGDLRPPFQRRIHGTVLRLAHRVLVNSPAVVERLPQGPALDPKRIVLIPNGVDAERFSPRTSARARRGERVMIGTLGNLRPEKGLADLIRAAVLVREHCPEARFVVWGDGPLRPDLDRSIEELGLGGVVELRGRTTAPEAALRELDIFALPSLSEACSNGLLEAMATGLAVVATRVGGNLALVEDGDSGLLVPAGDPAALAKALTLLSEQPALASTLGARARERVLAEFGLEPMLTRVEALYEQALAGRVA